MKDFIYIDMLSPDLKDTLRKKQAYSYKALKDGLWGISPDYLEFLDNLIMKHDSINNVLSIEYDDIIIKFNIVYNKNYSIKINYFKTMNKLLTNNFDDLYSILKSSKDERVKDTVKKYIHDMFFQSVFKQLNGITFESLFVIERHHIKSLLKS